MLFMLLDVLRCSQDALNHQLLTDVLYTFSDVFKMCSDVLRSSQMFSDDHRCFLILSRYSIDVLLMFSGFFQDVFRMLQWILWAWWNLMIISNESMNFNGPKESYDPKLFDDPSYSMIPRYSMIPSYSMIN